MPIALTRALLRAALQGALSGADFRKDPYFGVDVPVSAPGVDATLLDPAATWASRDAYDATAERVVDLFTTNFAGLAPFVDPDVKAAGPRRP
jgi:phosphoenolpyruvate carboxykinase (ATP)